MLTNFFDIKGIVRFELIPQAKQSTKLIMWKYWSGYVKPRIEWKPELWTNDKILHHDNATAHKELCVNQFLVQKSISVLVHPPYYPDFAPNDFWLFPKIKSALNERRFQDTEDIQKNVTTALKGTAQQEFQKCFQQWQHRWAKCIAAQVEYFEGDPCQ
jgi:hypothetical protein